MHADLASPVRTAERQGRTFTQDPKADAQGLPRAAVIRLSGDAAKLPEKGLLFPSPKTGGPLSNTAPDKILQKLAPE